MKARNKQGEHCPTMEVAKGIHRSFCGSITPGPRAGSQTFPGRHIFWPPSTHNSGMYDHDGVMASWTAAPAYTSEAGNGVLTANTRAQPTRIPFNEPPSIRMAAMMPAASMPLGSGITTPEAGNGARTANIRSQYEDLSPWSLLRSCLANYSAIAGPQPLHGPGATPSNRHPLRRRASWVPIAA